MAHVYSVDTRKVVATGGDGSGDLDAQALVEWDGGAVWVPAPNGGSAAGFRALMEAHGGVDRRLSVTLRVGTSRAVATLELAASAPFGSVASSLASLSSAGLEQYDVIEWLDIVGDPAPGPYSCRDSLLVAIEFEDGLDGRYMVSAPSPALLSLAEGPSGSADLDTLLGSLASWAISPRGGAVSAIKAVTRTRSRAK